MATAENHLIELLPRKERRRLLAICERIELVRGEVLGDRGNATRNVYFPTEGFISLVTPLDGKPVLEVGLVGREGMWGSHLALGVVTEPLHPLVQGSGAAWRLGNRNFAGIQLCAALRRQRRPQAMDEHAFVAILRQLHENGIGIQSN